MISIGDIERAYEALQVKRSDLAIKTEKEIAAKSRLASKKAELLMSGAIIGKNQEARDAQLAEATKEETAECLLAEADKRSANLEYEISSMIVSMYRDMLKLMEIEKL